MASANASVLVINPANFPNFVKHILSALEVDPASVDLAKVYKIVRKSFYFPEEEVPTLIEYILRESKIDYNNVDLTYTADLVLQKFNNDHDNTVPFPNEALAFNDYDSVESKVKLIQGSRAFECNAIVLLGITNQAGPFNKVLGMHKARAWLEGQKHNWNDGDTFEICEHKFEEMVKHELVSLAEGVVVLSASLEQPRARAQAQPQPQPQQERRWVRRLNRWVPGIVAIGSIVGSIFGVLSDLNAI